MTDPTDRQHCHTAMQAALLRAADKLLKDQADLPQEPADNDLLDPDCIATFGLRPTWHGRP